MKYGLNSGAFGAVLGLLLAFGVLFNLGVGYLNRRGWSEGFTSLLVVAGVGATLLALLVVLAAEVVAMVLLAFVASGTPMIAGDIYRYVKRREEEKEQLRELAHDEPTTLAE